MRTQVTASVLDQTEHELLVANQAAGAVLAFSGVVRNHDDSREVTALQYTAHPSAPDVLRDVVAGIAAEVVGVRAIAVSHRVGDLRVGDVAFVVAVAADHRRDAFAACERLVNEVKATIPVWKHQHFVDGSDEWVGSA